MTVTTSQLDALTNGLLDRLSHKNRYIDLACQLVVYERIDDELVRTDTVSPIYGGKWDKWTNRYSDLQPDKIIQYKCSQKQFEVLTEAARCDKHHILVIGARRSAKSELMAMWTVIRALEYPGKPTALLFKKFEKAKQFLEQKVLPRVLDLILPGKYGYRKSPNSYGITYANGSILSFLSAEVVDSPRGLGCAAAGCDERQIVRREIMDNLILSLSEGGKKFQTLENGTALEGEFQDYFDLVSQDPGYHIAIFTTFDNPFIDRKFIDDAKKYMDPRRYAQEILSQFTPQTSVVYHQFAKSTHVKPFAAAKRVLVDRYGIYEGVGKDITKEVMYHWFRKHECNWVIGLDFNVSPMVATIFKILKAPPGLQDIWWMIDELVLEDRADASKMALDLKKKGYYPAVIIPDASGAYSEGGRSSHRQLRDEGFNVFCPKQNPFIRDRINAVNAKLQDQRGNVTFFIDNKCTSIIKCMQNYKIDSKGKPEKDMIHEHRSDSLGYPISFLCPAAIDWEKETRISKIANG